MGHTEKFTPFGGEDIQEEDIGRSRIVILPLCYENEPSYGSGSREGSLHILNASSQLERLDEEALSDWGSFKIHTMHPLYPSFDPQKAVQEMQKTSESIINQNKFLLSLGGDHAISIGPIMAAANHHSDVGILHIDAHLDLRNEWNGSRYNHACVMRRVVEDMGLPVVHVGIRSFSPEEAVFAERIAARIFYAHRIKSADDAWIEDVVDALPPKVYLTIDLDGLDPSVIPGTGTPEPGGLSYRQLVTLIKHVGWKRKVVAADINELVKINGSNVSEYTAAKIATKILVYCT